MIRILPLLALSSTFMFLSAAGATDDPLLGESREIAGRFGAQLKEALVTAMAGGGPAAAIEVCKTAAPRIASELSRQSGAKVARTSLRYRNPVNMPEPWQATVLRDFDEKAGGNGIPEFSARDESGVYRYMKAIPTTPLCLSCHGSELPEDLRRTLDKAYPHDRARGYRAGDLRGAFTITWPAAAPAP